MADAEAARRSGGAASAGSPGLVDGGLPRRVPEDHVDNVILRTLAMPRLTLGHERKQGSSSRKVEIPTWVGATVGRCAGIVNGGPGRWRQTWFASGTAGTQLR